MITPSISKFDVHQSATVPTTFATVAEKAEKHIHDFLLECTNPKILPSMRSDPQLQALRAWSNTCKKVYAKIKKEDNTFPAWTDGLEFLQVLLSWLDDREPNLEWPWRRGKFRQEIEDVRISHLLNLFKGMFLDRLCIPRRPPVKQKDLDRVVDKVLADIGLLKYFLEYVGMSGILDGNQWDVQLVAVGPKDGPIVPSHFLSWLVVDDKNKILYILYNKEAIILGTNDTYEAITRLEMVFLHEFGHAVSHLEWYKKRLEAKDSKWHLACKGREWISTPALIEFEAWAYALAFRGIVKSTRSWITRLVKESDDEWLNP